MMGTEHTLGRRPFNRHLETAKSYRENGIKFEALRRISCRGSWANFAHSAGGGDDYTCIEWNRAPSGKPTKPCDRCEALILLGAV